MRLIFSYLCSSSFSTSGISSELTPIKNGIKIIGDIPIYVSLDSADAWSHPELFQLDEHCTPKAVAGCPPDGFSADGQMWGNPLYDWGFTTKNSTSRGRVHGDVKLGNLPFHLFPKEFRCNRRRFHLRFADLPASFPAEQKLPRQ